MTDIETQVMARKYQSILLQVQGMTFSWNVAVRLVGGKKRLERLMAEERYTSRSRLVLRTRNGSSMRPTFSST